MASAMMNQTQEKGEGEDTRPKKQSNSTCSMPAWEKYSRIVSSLAIFALDKVLASMIVPVIAEWDWAVMFPDPIITKDLPPCSSQIDLSLLNITECQDAALSVASDSSAGQLDPLLLIVFLVVPITAILVSPIAGVAGDNFGHDLLVLFGVVDACVISALFASSSTFPVVVTARFLLGLGSSMTHLNTLGRVFKVVTPYSQESNVVVGLFLASYSFQFFLPGIFGVIYEHYGRGIAFASMIPIEIILAASVVSTYQFQFTPVGHKPPKKNDKPTERSTDEVTLYQVFSDGRILLLSCVITITWLPKTCLEPVLALWVQQEYAGDAGTTSMIWGIAGFSVLVACGVSVCCIKYCSSDYLLLYTTFHFAFSTIPVALLPHMPSPPAVAICFTFSVYFASSSRYGAMIILSRLAEKEFSQSFGKVMSVAHVGFALPYVLAPLVAIPLYNNVGFKLMCMVIAPISILFLPWLVFVRRGGRKSDSEPVIIHVPDYAYEHEKKMIHMEPIKPHEFHFRPIEPAPDTVPVAVQPTFDPQHVN